MTLIILIGASSFWPSLIVRCRASVKANVLWAITPLLLKLDNLELTCNEYQDFTYVLEGDYNSNLLTEEEYNNLLEEINQKFEIICN